MSRSEIPGDFEPKEPAGSQKEALQMFEAWCEANGGEASSSYHEYPEMEFMGEVTCKIGDNFEMEMNAGRATLAPDGWMEERGADIEVRIREDSGPVFHNTHRKVFHHDEVNFTDTGEELHVDWETFYVEDWVQ